MPSIFSSTFDNKQITKINTAIITPIKLKYFLNTGANSFFIIDKDQEVKLPSEVEIAMIKPTIIVSKMHSIQS